MTGIVKTYMCSALRPKEQVYTKPYSFESGLSRKACTKSLRHADV